MPINRRAAIAMAPKKQTESSMQWEILWEYFHKDTQGMHFA
jgi:hypothetical protein